MPLTSKEAADTLRDIDRTARRSAKAYGYSAGSPHLILWGVIWAIGYGTFALHPDTTRYPALVYAWPILSVIGLIGSFWIGSRIRPATATRFNWRFAATVVAVMAFIFAVFAVMPPKGEQMGVFFPLLVGLFYTLIGIWTKGARMIVLGAAVAALTLFAYFVEPAQFALWMAAVGGGGLILGGIWLRSV